MDPDTGPVEKYLSGRVFAGRCAGRSKKLLQLWVHYPVRAKAGSGKCGKQYLERKKRLVIDKEIFNHKKKTGHGKFIRF
jgi:hypothetical protein